MKCPNCGFHNVDWAESCKKCSGELKPRFVRRAPRARPPLERKDAAPDMPEPSEAPGPPGAAELMAEEAPAPRASAPPPVPTGEPVAEQPGGHKSAVENPEIGEGFQPPPAGVKPPSQPIAQTQDVPVEMDMDLNLDSELEPEPFDKPPSSAEPVSEVPPSGLDSDVLGMQDELLEHGMLDELREIEGYDEIIDDRELVTFDLAGFGVRVAALALDAVVVILVVVATLVVGVYVAGVEEATTLLGLMSIPVMVLASLYFIVLPGFSGQTLGKKVFGIRIIGDRGEPIGILRALIRWVGYYISSTFLCLGFIWAIFDGNSQTWHDKLAKTYVVKD